MSKQKALMQDDELRKAKEASISDQIDVDMPFDAKEVESATSASYVEQLTRSDVAVAQAAAKVAVDFCSLGQRNCRRFLKQGVCRQEKCPLVVAERKKEGRAAVATAHVFDPIDVDMPFSAGEVTALTSEAYMAALGPSDMPIVGHWGQSAPTARVPKVLAENDRNELYAVTEKALKANAA